MRRTSQTEASQTVLIAKIFKIQDLMQVIDKSDALDEVSLIGITAILSRLFEKTNSELKQLEERPRNIRQYFFQEIEKKGDLNLRKFI